MSTKRSQNRCKDCGYTWYPKGSHLSRKCPSCGSKNVTFAGCGCSTLVLGTIAVSILFALFGGRTESDSSTPAPSSTPIPVPSPTTEAPTSPVEQNAVNTPTPSPYPRTVVASKDFSVSLEHGVLGIKRGQRIQLLKQNGDKFDAASGAFLFSIDRGSFEETPH